MPTVVLRMPTVVRMPLTMGTNPRRFLFCKSRFQVSRCVVPHQRCGGGDGDHDVLFCEIERMNTDDESAERERKSKQTIQHLVAPSD